MTDAATKFQRLFHDVCPLKIGDTVTVASDFKWSGDWPDRYIVVAIRWDYQIGAGNDVNIAIASEDEIVRRNGSTDGFSPRDLVFVSRFDRHNQQ